MNSRLLVGSLLCLLAFAAPARAQYPTAPPPQVLAPPPPAIAPPPPAPVSDAVLRAVVGRDVELHLASGQLLGGLLLSLEPETATVAVVGGQVLAVARATIVEVRLVQAFPKPPPPTPPSLPPVPKAALVEVEPTDRHIGVMFGLGPGVLAVDVASGAFYGFLSGSLALPMYSINTDSTVAGLTLAPGLSFKISADRNWHFDLFVHGSVGFYSHSNYDYTTSMTQHYTNADGSIGVGMGFHYTSQSGFTVGFKVPILGFAFGGDVTDLRSSGGYYYLNALVSFPAATLGYRF